MWINFFHHLFWAPKMPKFTTEIKSEAWYTVLIHDNCRSVCDFYYFTFLYNSFTYIKVLSYI